MIELIKRMMSLGVSPNGYYILWCIANKQEPLSAVNVALELRILKNHGFLSTNNEITSKGKDVLDIQVEDKVEVTSKGSLNFNTFIETYREIFPPGKVHGYAKRDSVQDLKQQFKKWFGVYNYSYDKILEVTKDYVEEEMESGGKYLKSSYYMLFKKGEPSLLAKLCEQHGKQNGTEKVSFNEEI